MPHSNIEEKTRQRAKTLRKDMTRAEIAMWSMLRDFRPFGARFRRETPIGAYIADFAWLSAKTVIEVDGDSHATSGGIWHDRVRDRFMQSQGFTVLRFDNDQVLDGPDFVFLTIEKHIRPFLKKTLGNEDYETDSPFLPESRKNLVISKALKDSIESLVHLRLDMLKGGNSKDAEKIRNDLLVKGVRLTDSKDSETGMPTTAWELVKGKRI